MSWNKLEKNTLVISLLTILAVSVAGCSSFSEVAKGWEEHARAEKVAVAAVVSQEVKTPPVPPYVANCIRKGLDAARKAKLEPKKVKTIAVDPKAPGAVAVPPPPSADALVLAELQGAEERQKCAGAVLAWYKQLQAANKLAVTNSS